MTRCEPRELPVVNPFTIVALPDTQYYSQYAKLAPIFAAQTQWVVNNRVTENVAFVTHPGDIVQNGATGTNQNLTGWQRADAAIKILDGNLVAQPDGVLPYSVALGNHDSKSSTATPAARRGTSSSSARNAMPGGMIGVVDFYVSRKWPAEGRRKHAGPTRAFWPSWFAYDNVFPSPDHLRYLSYRFTPVAVEERAGRNPYLLGIKVPYSLFVGRKPA